MSRINLRSSSFGDYCFGMYTKKDNKMFNDLYDIQEEFSWFQNSLMQYGTKHERHGIAEFVNWFGEMPENILGEQVNLVVPVTEVMSISSTPDGFCMEGNGLVEVKCTKTKKQAKPDFDARWLPQIYGQMLVVNQYYAIKKIPKKIEKTFLVNWAEKSTKIYKVERNKQAIDLILSLLKHYGHTLRSVKECVKDLPAYIDLTDEQKRSVLKMINEKYNEHFILNLTNHGTEEMQHEIMEKALKENVMLVYESSV